MEKKNFDILPKYNTMKFGYSNEDFDNLKSLFEYNVYNNKTEMVAAIQKVINRKQNFTTNDNTVITCEGRQEKTQK